MKKETSQPGVKERDIGKSEMSNFESNFSNKSLPPTMCLYGLTDVPQIMKSPEKAPV